MKKKLVIITGISGAGKNTALSIFESQGYFCTDNLPGLLVEDFLRIIEEKEIDKTAISIDIRSKHLHVDLKELFKKMFSITGFSDVDQDAYSKVEATAKIMNVDLDKVK